MKTLIVGVGSVLRGDDALGIRVIDELEKELLPDDITLYSGDISGLDLLKAFPGNERVVIIDAAEMGEAPGTIKVFNFKDIEKADFKDVVSTHGMGLLETLTIGEKIGLDADITIIGVQPENIDHSLELSDLIKSKIPEVIQAVKKAVE